MPFLIHEVLIAADSPHVAGRVDRCVQSLVGESRSFVTGLFDHDCVQVNGEFETSPGRSLQTGDRVRVRYERDRRYSPRPRRRQPHRGFTIVHEDRDLIVVDKSSELLTIPTDAGESHTLVDRLQEHVRHEGRQRGAFVVHRLDRGVSGLLVFGKTRESANALQRQFSQRRTEREYRMLVAGVVATDAGEVRSHLATGKSLTRFSTQPSDETELAITHYRVARRLYSATELIVRLETGRRNQIRVHFAEAGHPVLGDPRYRPDLAEHPDWPYRRLALHAALLAFEHPETGEALQFTSPLPVEFANFAHQQSDRERANRTKRARQNSPTTPIDQKRRSRRRKKNSR